MATRQARAPAARKKQRQDKALTSKLRESHREWNLGRAQSDVGDDDVVVRFSRKTLVRRFAL